MIDIRKLIQAELKAVHPRVYYQVAPETAVFPYIVYDLPNVYDDGEGYQLITLDVDGWENKDDTTALETLMASINARLNKKTLANSNITITLYLENKLTLTDDVPTIRRRKYTYQGRKFGRS
jgi:hypothetical protein